MYSQILQLHGPSARVSGGRQPFVERPVAVVQLPFHEHLTHDGVDERRVHAVAAEIARPRHPGRERLQSVEPAFEASTAEFHPLKFEHAGQTPRREGDLEIVSARIGIEVEHLAGEIEPFDPERLHRVLVHLVAANAAGRRHDRVFEGGIVRNREHHTLQQLDKPLDLGLGDLADIVFEWMSSSFASGMTSGLGTSFRNSSEKNSSGCISSISRRMRSRSTSSVSAGFISSWSFTLRPSMIASTASRLSRSATAPSIPRSENPISPNSSRTGSLSTKSVTRTFLSGRPFAGASSGHESRPAASATAAPVRSYAPGRRRRDSRRPWNPWQDSSCRRS